MVKEREVGSCTWDLEFEMEAFYTHALLNLETRGFGSCTGMTSPAKMPRWSRDNARLGKVATAVSSAVTF